jgi:hypothetical protein
VAGDIAARLPGSRIRTVPVSQLVVAFVNLDRISSKNWRAAAGNDFAPILTGNDKFFLEGSIGVGEAYILDY